MENTTKSRILDEALVLFAENGYKGTNLRELASRLGLSKSALYKHYAGKEDIWNALLDRMETYYAEMFGSAEKLPKQPETCEELVAMTMKMIDFTVHDERIILTRKILLTEQFHDERARRLASKHFLYGTRNMFQRIFEKMIVGGMLINADPEMLAFAYTSPITSLIQLCTREPDKQEEVMERAEEFVKFFVATYKGK